MEKQLEQSQFDFVCQKDKEFVALFDRMMEEMGYCGQVSEGYCWGKRMIIYTKAGVKSKKSFARVYLREGETVLRFYFSRVEEHAAAIEEMPEHIVQAFTREQGRCSHCHNQREDGSCAHRKAYTLGQECYEKCDGFTFEFWQPTASRLPDYQRIFREFYPEKRNR